MIFFTSKNLVILSF